jgi:PAS domain S-box-containing protein
VVIPPGSGRLTIHYNGLCLSAAGNVRYKYRVEGLDRDWIDVANQRVAYLQVPRPGTYRFHVQAANSHGVWTEAPATVVLVVQPFYWQTLWFQALVVAALMAAAGLGVWGVTRGRLRRQSERLSQQRLLAREKARLASVLEATSDLVAFLDEAGNVLYLNPAGRTMAGLADESSVQGLTVSGLHPAWAAQRLLQEGIPTAVRAGTWSGETALLHKGGHEIALSQVMVAHHAADGSLSFLSTIARDISQRKRTEEQLRGSLREKEALLREIHHRVKNNLQLINSLLSLQAARVKDPSLGDVLKESQDRVRTMALVHENLYRAGNVASIPLAAHVEGLCAHLFCSYGAAENRIELATHVDDVSLDLDRAIPCGLIINELVSNALKHAFPAGRAGRVSVDFHALPEGGYALAVRDDGVGLPAGLDPGQAESMGLQLVSDLTEQLNGMLAVDRTGGTTFTIRFHAEPRGRAQP